MIKLKNILKSASTYTNPNYSTKEPLMDTEGDIHNSFGPLDFEELGFETFGHFINKEDYLKVIVSSLYYIITPSTYQFLKFITWLASAYISQRNVVTSPKGENILEVTNDLIRKYFCFPYVQNSHPFTEDSLLLNFTRHP